MKLSDRPKKRWLVLAVLSVVSALLLIIVQTAFSIYSYRSQTHYNKADAAIVLGAAVWGSQPSPVFRERINHAVKLYTTNQVKTLVFTGGIGDKNEPAEATVGKRYAVMHGVAEADILTELVSRTTHQNLKNSLPLLTVNQLNKLLIVSDPLHMKRAVLMARDLGMDAYPSPTLTTRYRSLSSQLEFLIRETYFYFIYLLFKV